MQRRRMIDRPNQVQGKSWISVIWGVILLIVGFGTMMSTSAAIGAVWTLVAVFLIVSGVRKALAPKNAFKLDDSVEKVVSRIQNKAPEKKTVRSKQETHDHIPSTALDVEARLVTKAGRPVVLTNKEFGLLVLFIRNKNVALFRETLYEKVWEGEYSGDSRTLDLHVQRLRRKLGWENSLVAVYKVGYRLEVPG